MNIVHVGREKDVAAIIVRTYAQKGWVLFKEFQIPGTILDLGNSIGIGRQRLRPDIFGLRKGIVLAIEVENAPFLHHATSYVPIANYCYLAYPEDTEPTLTQETVEEQLSFARSQGIGVLRVWVGANRVTEHLPAVRREIRPEIKARLIQLAWKRYVCEKISPYPLGLDRKRIKKCSSKNSFNESIE